MSDAAIWLVIALCAVVTVAIKAVGPVLMGGRELPAAFTRVVVLMAPALLAALIVTNALADGERLRVGADTAGVVASAAAFWRTGSVILTVAVAVVVTAGLRALGVAS